MIIRLKDMLPGPRHFDLSFESSGWGEGDPHDAVVGLDGPLDVHLTVTKEGDRYTVEGSLEGKIRARCDRCLNIYSHVIESDFKLLLTTLPREAEGRERELLEEDMAVEFIMEDEIEIDHIVREQLYLSLPMKLLCHESCQGLCPVCGMNLNHGSCRCAGHSGHPAFSKLKQLKFDQE